MNQEQIDKFYEDDLKKKVVKKAKSDWKKKIYKNFEYKREMNNGMFKM